VILRTISLLLFLTSIYPTLSLCSGIETFEKSSEQFQQACDFGVTDACFDSWKRQSNKEILLNKYGNKCSAGKKNSCFNLALYNEESGDFIKADTLYRKACSEIAPSACLRVGENLFNEKKYQDAIPFLTKSCDAKQGQGCYLLAKITNTLATAELKTECDAKNSKACDLLARAQGKMDKTSTDGLLKACEGGIMASCYDLAKVHDKNFDVQNARTYYKKACDGNHLLACSDIGYLENMAGNGKAAKKYYRKACKGGEKSGCKRMKHLTD